MVQTYQDRTAPGSERKKGKYAIIAAVAVAIGLLVWYLTATLVVAPTIDGPAADEVQGLAPAPAQVIPGVGE